VYAPESEVARLAYFALYALQHRGQESAGIATTDSGDIVAVREIGHVRYSTTGSSAWQNAQPIHRSDHHNVALAHNGNLINAVELHAELRDRGVGFTSTSDSEIIAALISTHEADSVFEAIADIMPRLEGAFSTVVMSPEGVFAFRDGAGLRPLALGQLGERYCVASESCAFDIIGAELLREVQPGELVGLGERGIELRQVVESERRAFCVFEHIYFARPDSKLEDKRVQVSRERMGEILWRESPVEADLVIAVPDSGSPAANGFAKASALPQGDGLIKNRYVARTFIQPGQELRKHGLRMKFNPLPEIVGGKRIVVVDDSIVRGNTTRQIIGMLRDAGASEVHLRISAPPIRHPCHYGIDMSTRQEMIAHDRTVEEVARELGADSLAYLSLEGLYEAIGSTRETHCDACFTGEYPLERTEQHRGKNALEELAVVRA
jgi:amidophosphoribosyltransferase